LYLKKGRLCNTTELEEIDQAGEQPWDELNQAIAERRARDAARCRDAAESRIARFRDAARNGFFSISPPTQRDMEYRADASDPAGEEARRNSEERREKELKRKLRQLRKKEKALLEEIRALRSRQQWLLNHPGEDEWWGEEYDPRGALKGYASDEGGEEKRGSEEAKEESDSNTSPTNSTTKPKNSTTNPLLRATAPLWQPGRSFQFSDSAAAETGKERDGGDGGDGDESESDGSLYAEFSYATDHYGAPSSSETDYSSDPEWDEVEPLVTFDTL
jgi:hypothetical protein